MIDVETSNVELFRMAAGRVVDSLGDFYFLNRDAGYRADAGALVAADAVFGEKIEPVVAIFGHGGFFVGVGEGYAPVRHRSGALPDDGGPSPKSLHEVLENQPKSHPEATHCSKKQKSFGRAAS